MQLRNLRATVPDKAKPVLPDTHTASLVLVVNQVLLRECRFAAITAELVFLLTGLGDIVGISCEAVVISGKALLESRVRHSENLR